MLVNTSAGMQLLRQGFGTKNPESIVITVWESGGMRENCSTT
jgi:hypothetical protein